MNKDLTGNNLLAIKEFSSLLKQKIGSNLCETRVFGSVARGTATSESDIDILVLLEDKTLEVRDVIAEITLDVNLKYDVVLAPIIMTKEHYSNPLFQETAFFKNLIREGSLF